MSKVKDRKMIAQWGDEILDMGFFSIPQAFLKYYAELGITMNEAMFVIQVMASPRDYSMTENDIAMLMGCSRGTIRNLKKSLIQKELLEEKDAQLRRSNGEFREGGAMYNFRNLIVRLREKLEEFEGISFRERVSEKLGGESEIKSIKQPLVKICPTDEIDPHRRSKIDQRLVKICPTDGQKLTNGQPSTPDITKPSEVPIKRNDNKKEWSKKEQYMSIPSEVDVCDPPTPEANQSFENPSSNSNSQTTSSTSPEEPEAPPLKNPTKHAYNPKFEEIVWKYYLRKDSKEKAEQQVLNRVKEGWTFEQLGQAARNYFIYKDRVGHSKEKTQMGRTFFGKLGDFKEFIDINPEEKAAEDMKSKNQKSFSKSQNNENFFNQFKQRPDAKDVTPPPVYPSRASPVLLESGSTQVDPFSDFGKGTHGN